jgi:hypothetical protein
MMTAEGHTMSSCKERMNLLFNPTILQGDCHFVEEFFNFESRMNNEQRAESTFEYKGKARKDRDR